MIPRGNMRNTPHPIDIHVGSRVRLRRKMLKLTQEDLGRKLSLTFQQVQKYEKGTNRISASRLFLIAEILDVVPQWFFDGLKEIEDNPVLGEIHLFSIENIELLDAAVRL
jgi:transcriptional regulator with XRE-family HTH domain